MLGQRRRRWPNIKTALDCGSPRSRNTEGLLIALWMYASTGQPSSYPWAAPRAITNIRDFVCGWPTDLRDMSTRMVFYPLI